MFDHFVWSVVTVPPLLVVAVWLIAGRISPASGARLLAWSAAVVAAASTANLLVFSLKAAAELPGVAHLFGWSHETVAADTAQVPWVSWLSVLLLAYAVIAAVLVVRQARRAVATQRAVLATAQQGDVVLADDERPIAYAVPGRPGRIVVSTAMRNALSERQFAALLAHERAHLAHRHARLVLLARAAAVAHPALWWVSTQVEYLAERAADEEAAKAVGSRTTVARAIGAAALLASGREPALLSFAAARRKPGPVPQRVAALLDAGAPARPAWLILPVALAAATVIWTGEAIYDLAELLLLAS